MAAPPVLFTIPIAPLAAHAGGSVTCTQPQRGIYQLTFESAPDNRLTHAFTTALLRALDEIEFAPPGRFPPGVVVTTSAIAKFYSNGLDLAMALGTPRWMESHLYPLFRRLLTYPMPTVALVNGHCFAGGFMLAMHHDYRVFSGDRGYMCVNEVEFGAPLLPPMAGIFRVKLSPVVYRDTVLEARRWDAKSALAAGIIDSTSGMDGLLQLVAERGLVKRGVSGIYGVLKTEMYREQVDLLDNTTQAAADAQHAKEDKRKAEGKARLAMAAAKL